MNPFSEKMAQFPDEQLLAIVTRLRNDYQPDAVAAAEAEIHRRGLALPAVPADEEPEQLTLEEIRNEIAGRKASGESTETILADMKRRGLDVFEYAEADQEDEAKNNPDFARKRTRTRFVFAVILGTGFILLKLYSGSRYNHDRDLQAMLTLVIAVIALVVFFVWERRQRSN